MRRLISTLLLAAVPAVVLAETGPADFARAATIRTGPDAQIFKVRLPDDVYLTVTRPDLGDLRVFNAAGEALPHTLRTVPPTVTDEEVRWRTLTAAGSSTNGQVQYDTGGMFPVEYVQVEFADAADVAHLDVRSRALSSREWVLRHAGFFYALTDPSGTMRNSPARIARTTDRYWSLEGANARSRQSGHEPRIQIGWYPHELVFVRQGSPPYTLAYGNARAVAADAPVDTLLATLSSDARDSQVMTATLEEPRTVAGGSALKPAPRRIVLWVILLTVVAVLAVVAMRIFRESESRSG